MPTMAVGAGAAFALLHILFSVLQLLHLSLHPPEITTGREVKASDSQLQLNFTVSTETFLMVDWNLANVSLVTTFSNSDQCFRVLSHCCLPWDGLCRVPKVWKSRNHFEHVSLLWSKGKGTESSRFTFQGITAFSGSAAHASPICDVMWCEVRWCECNNLPLLKRCVSQLGSTEGLLGLDGRLI